MDRALNRYVCFTQAIFPAVAIGRSNGEGEVELAPAVVPWNAAATGKYNRLAGRLFLEQKQNLSPGYIQRTEAIVFCQDFELEQGSIEMLGPLQVLDVKGGLQESSEGRHRFAHSLMITSSFLQ
jgi:hypothetical protein